MLTFYTIAEMAKRMKISRVAVWKKIKSGKLKAVQVAPKLWLVIVTNY